MKGRRVALLVVLGASLVALAGIVSHRLGEPADAGPPPVPPLAAGTVSWLGCGAPEVVRPGETFLVLAHLENRGDRPWPHRGEDRVELAVRWLDATGVALVATETRTALAADLAPGEALATWSTVTALARPGRWLVELEAVRGPAPASERGAAVCRAGVAVDDAEPLRSGGPGAAAPP